MRTTLTIDDDVAALLEHKRRTSKASLKSVINEALRQGLKEMRTPFRRGKPYQSRSVSLGRCLVGNLDDISEALAMGEPYSRLSISN
ncbi:MAG: ribbon-helix-helix protein, CopG family [Deltaproteobacteria bacterium]|nr:ribbon-helix-helix protein, CopG family [Deltaproteobacteria bacterium]